MVEKPDTLVRETTEKVLKRLREDPNFAAGKVESIVAVVESLVLEHFDFERMTRLAVGKNWRNVEDAKKSVLVREFQTLLVRTYSVALMQLRDQTIEYIPLLPDPASRSALVQTTITQASGAPIAMHYRMAASDHGWQVYDVIVDGVSLVINYRSLFNSTIESSGVDGLIKLLEDKNAEAQ